MEKNSIIIGMQVGSLIAGMRRVAKKPVAFLYNGVRLPALPKWDREVYPYAYITYDIPLGGDGERYLLWLSPVQLYAFPFWGDYGIHSNGVVTNALYYQLSADGDSWECQGEWGKLSHTFSPRWCNTDMYLGSIDSNDNLTVTDTVHLKASDPIPVYE